MPTRDDLALLAGYNAWMNERLYDAAAGLPDDELARDRGAFFGSLLGTLNHLVVADTLWLQRFARARPGDAALQPVRELPSPASLAEVLFTRLADLRERRQRLDAVISAWTGGLDEAALDTLVPYANMRGMPAKRRLGSLLVHLFNHQTHHRGQASTLLTQAGVDIGVTDLLARIPDEA